MTPTLLAGFLFLLAPSGVEEVQAPEETITLPGSKVQFKVVRLPGDKAIKPFWMGACEVSWEEFNLYYGDENKSNLDLLAVDGVTRPTRAKSFFGQVLCPKDFLEGRRPAINVRWHGAMGYCDWVSHVTGKRFRLPTEAEWEFACKGGGDAPAWHEGTSGKRTHEVGDGKPNSFGLLNLRGNVWEYCLEFANAPEYLPVLRGGAWNMPAAQVTAEARKTVLKEWYGADPNRPRSSWWLTDEFTQGFRLVMIDPGADPKTVKDYLAQKIEIKIAGYEDVLAKDRPGLGSHVVRVQGEVKNGGAKTLDELDLLVYYLTPEGKPHLLDIVGADKPGRVSYGRAFPVLSNGADAAVRPPLRPGESRAFVVEFPQSSDDPGTLVAPDKFGARATGLRFAPE